MTPPEFPTSLLGLALDTDDLDLEFTSKDVIVTSHAIERVGSESRPYPDAGQSFGSAR